MKHRLFLAIPTILSILGCDGKNEKPTPETDKKPTIAKTEEDIEVIKRRARLKEIGVRIFHFPEELATEERVTMEIEIYAKAYETPVDMFNIFLDECMMHRKTTEKILRCTYDKIRNKRNIKFRK